MDEFIASENTQEVAEPVEETQVEENVSEEVVEPQRPVQDAETNAQFARVRRETEQKAKDQVIAQLYGQYGINTYAEYEQAVRQQQMQAEAEKKNMDPEVYETIQSLVSKVNNYERQTAFAEQDTTLQSDPTYGDFYKKYRDEVKNDAQVYGVDLDTAFTWKLREKLPEILSSTSRQIEQTTVKNLINNKTTSPGPVGQDGPDVKSGYLAMSPTERRAFREKVKRGET